MQEEMERPREPEDGMGDCHETLSAGAGIAVALRNRQQLWVPTQDPAADLAIDLSPALAKEFLAAHSLWGRRIMLC